jgi:alpha-methylacyl-CoA racemase
VIERPAAGGRPQALAGITVLDLTRLLPGGFATMLLGDLGADVIKVEDPSAGDYLRWTEPRYEGAAPSAASAIFIALNRNKRSLRVDLKAEPGRALLKRLAGEADVLVESFRPGAMERLGLGYQQLREVNPRLVYCSITGYGQEGEYRERPGHDLNYLGIAGALALSGERDGPPAQSAVQIADVGGGGLPAAFAILAALTERSTSGEGQHVDVSMTAGALSWLMMAAAGYLCDGELPRRGEPDLAGGVISYRPYRCADGWVTLGAVESKFWAAFCRGVGREDLIAAQHEPPGSPAHREVETILAGGTRQHWRRFGEQHGCCLEPVLELDEALSSPAAAGALVTVAQPGVERPVRALSGPVRLGRTPAAVWRPAPALGEHTVEIAREAGLQDSEVAALLREGVLGEEPDACSPTFRL